MKLSSILSVATALFMDVQAFPLLPSKPTTSSSVAPKVAFEVFTYHPNFESRKNSKPPPASVQLCQSEGKNCQSRPLVANAWNTPSKCEMNIQTGYFNYIKPDSNLWCRLYPLGACYGRPYGLINVGTTLGSTSKTKSHKNFKLEGYQCIAVQPNSMGLAPTWPGTK